MNKFSIQDFANAASQARVYEKIVVSKDMQQISLTSISWKDKLINLLRNVPLLNRLVSPEQKNIRTQALFLKVLAAHYGDDVATASAEKFSSYFVTPNGAKNKALTAYTVREIIDNAKKLQRTQKEIKPTFLSINESAIAENSEAKNTIADGLIEKLQARFPEVDDEIFLEALERFDNKDEEMKRLTIEEFVALYLYTTDFNLEINEALRSQNAQQLAPWRNLINDATNGLYKLNLKDEESFRKAPLFRGVELMGKQSPFSLAKFQEGKTVVDAAFLSTSEDLNVAKTFAHVGTSFSKEGEGPMLLHIYTGAPKGKLASLSNSPLEAEVLLPPNIEFKVEFMGFDSTTKAYKAILKDNTLPANHGSRGYVDALTDQLKPNRTPLSLKDLV